MSDLIVSSWVFRGLPWTRNPFDADSLRRRLGFPIWPAASLEMGRERAAQAVARLLEEAAKSDELGTLPAFAPKRVTTTTQFFLDLVFRPLLLRALFGEKLKQLRAEIGPHVTRSVEFFLAACRHGGVP